MPKRTPAQNRQIHGLLKQIGKDACLDRDELAEIKASLCRQVSGQEHTSQLDQQQAARLIRLLAQRASGGSTAKRKTPAKSHEAGLSRMVTPRQQEVLEALFNQAGMLTLDQQRGFCRRQLKGRFWPQNQKDVTALYTPLTAMVLRRVSPAKLHERAQKLRGRPELDAWQTGFIDDLCHQFRNAHAEGVLDRVMTPNKLRRLVEAERDVGASLAA